MNSCARCLSTHSPRPLSSLHILIFLFITTPELLTPHNLPFLSSLHPSLPSAPFHFFFVITFFSLPLFSFLNSFFLSCPFLPLSLIYVPWRKSYDVEEKKNERTKIHQKEERIQRRRKGRNKLMRRWRSGWGIVEGI